VAVLAYADAMAGAVGRIRQIGHDPSGMGLLGFCASGGRSQLTRQTIFVGISREAWGAGVGPGSGLRKRVPGRTIVVCGIP
jgi:hypothetical protein